MYIIVRQGKFYVRHHVSVVGSYQQLQEKNLFVAVATYYHDGGFHNIRSQNFTVWPKFQWESTNFYTKKLYFDSLLYAKHYAVTMIMIILQELR